jgi:hypothetical protein
MEAPIISLELKANHWAVKIRCPFCGSIHKHGGGNVSTAPTLGQRSAHCSSGEYLLTMKDSSIVKGLPVNFFLGL